MRLLAGCGNRAVATVIPTMRVLRGASDVIPAGCETSDLAPSTSTPASGHKTPVFTSTADSCAERCSSQSINLCGPMLWGMCVASSEAMPGTRTNMHEHTGIASCLGLFSDASAQVMHPQRRPDSLRYVGESRWLPLRERISNHVEIVLDLVFDKFSWWSVRTTRCACICRNRCASRCSRHG